MKKMKRVKQYASQAAICFVVFALLCVPINGHSGLNIINSLMRLTVNTVFSDTYDTNTPLGSDDPAEADDRMREIKSAIQERENVDHYWPLTGTEVSDADTGEHRKVLFHAPIVATPTVAANHGDLRIKDTDGKAELTWTDEDENELVLTSKGQNLANATYLTATDEAGTGSVDLIKAGRNVADDTDVAIVPDLTRTASDAAPVEDTDLANKKYVDAHGVVQVVNTQTGAVSSSSAAIPLDDTIPQNTEGAEVMTLAITPKSATNKLKIDVVVNCSNVATGQFLTIALFQDTTADALAVTHNRQTTAQGLEVSSFTHFMTAGTTSSTTFKIRIGGTASATTFNGINTARKFGGVLASSITITEIKG